jgi:hypothetical protein
MVGILVPWIPGFDLSSWIRCLDFAWIRVLAGKADKVRDPLACDG